MLDPSRPASEPSDTAHTQNIWDHVESYATHTSWPVSLYTGFITLIFEASNQQARALLVHLLEVAKRPRSSKRIRHIHWKGKSAWWRLWWNPHWGCMGTGQATFLRWWFKQYATSSCYFWRQITFGLAQNIIHTTTIIHPIMLKQTVKKQIQVLENPIIHS